jgi:hypothetical protein
MSVTSAQDIYQSFEASFRDKTEIPESLEHEWLLKAIARYSVELSTLNFDEENSVFDIKLDRYVIDSLAAFMKQSYQEREVSKANKRVSIVGKDISINSGGHDKTAARNEMEYDKSKSSQMIQNQKQTAYV